MITFKHCMSLTLLIVHVTANNPMNAPFEEMIDGMIASNETQRFLSSFPNLDQRFVIENHLRYCPYSKLCGYAFWLDNNTSSCCEECSCDKRTCHVYDTCCPDLEKIPADMHLETKRNPMKCRLMHLVDKRWFSNTCAYMYAMCPEGTNTDIRNRCERSYRENSVSQMSDIVPVTNKKNGHIYRNKFCAFCNNLTKKHINFWFAKLSCKDAITIDINNEKTVIREAYKNEYCNIKFEPDRDANVVECTRAVSACNMTGLWKTYDPLLERACAFYRTPHYLHYLHEHAFRNVFCLLCNGKELLNYECYTRRGGAQTESFSFSALLNFGFFDESEPQSAPDDHGNASIYDPYQRTYRDVYCSPVRTLKNGTCYKLYSEMGETIYVMYLRLIPEDITTVDTAHALASQYLANISFYNDVLFSKLNEVPSVCGRQIIYTTDINITNNKRFSTIRDATLLYFDIKLQLVKSQLHDPDLVLQELMAIDNKTQKFKLNNDIFSFTLTLRDDSSDLFDHYLNVSYDKYWKNRPAPLIVSLSKMQSDSVVDTNGMVIFSHFQRNDKSMVCSQKYDKVNLLSIKPCTMFHISYREFQTEESMYGILFTERKYFLANTDFYYIDASSNNIGVCTDTYFKFAEQIQNQNLDFLNAESVVSIVCISISILALLVTLVTFAVFPQLRTLPGKNNISLVISLLTAQTVYLVGSFGQMQSGSVACISLGIAMHFCWLHSVCWMNVCTFHMFHVFFGVKHVVNQSSTKRLCVYHIYCISVAALLVAVNIVVSLISSEHQAIGYGKTICYISSSNMVGFTFGIPVGILLIANISMFIFTAIRIKQTGDIQKDVKHSRQNITIFAKLSTLTGIAWIFGFIYSFTNAVIFSYIFIVLNAGQGLFLLVAFVLNKRVIYMYRHKMFGYMSSTHADTNTTASNTLKTDE